MGIIKISLFMSLGTLTLTLVECKLTRDVKTMRKMDPYCSLTMREQEWRSATCECGSKKPKWENAVEIPKEEHESEMELAQKFMSELAQKKKVLEEEYESVQAQIDSTAEAVAEIEAEFVLCDCEAKYDEDVAAAHAKNDRILARIEKNKEVGEAAKDERWTPTAPSPCASRSGDPPPASADPRSPSGKTPRLTLTSSTSVTTSTTPSPMTTQARMRRSAVVNPRSPPGALSPRWTCGLNSNGRASPPARLTSPPFGLKTPSRSPRKNTRARWNWLKSLCLSSRLLTPRLMRTRSASLPVLLRCKTTRRRSTLRSSSNSLPQSKKPRPQTKRDTTVSPKRSRLLLRNSSKSTKRCKTTSPRCASSDCERYGVVSTRIATVETIKMFVCLMS